jgi:hypothetical protein
MHHTVASQKFDFYQKALGFLDISNPTPLSIDLFCLEKRIVGPTHPFTLGWGIRIQVINLYGSFGTAFKILQIVDTEHLISHILMF